MDQPTARRIRKPRRARHVPIMSELEFARLGGGEVAYIKILTSAQARRTWRRWASLAESRTA